MWWNLLKTERRNDNINMDLEEVPEWQIEWDGN
jgi:hypothetical protein